MEPSPQEGSSRERDADPSGPVVARHAPELVARATELFARQPDQEFGGVIACAGSQLGRLFAPSLPPEQRDRLATQTMVTLIPREDLTLFVRTHAPGLGEWLPDRNQPGRRVARTLPILVGVGEQHWCSVFQYDAV